MPRLLVTRPEPQASAWAEALAHAGVTAQALPLIAITPAPRPDAVTRLWQTLDHTRALMFVSPAAVDGFFQLRPPGATWPSTTLATAPGPGTANALRQVGAAAGLRPEQVVSPQADAPQFDSEALWPLLASMNWSGQAVTIVSGGDASGAQGRTWLTERWREAGATVNTVQTYQRGPGDWTPAQQALATEALDRFPDQFDGHWLAVHRGKLGLKPLAGTDEQDRALINEYLELLHTHQVDFTLGFRRLSAALRGQPQALQWLFGDGLPGLSAWLDRWQARLQAQGAAALDIPAQMDRINPVYIPRNHLVENALDAATESRDLRLFDRLLSVITRPWDERPEDALCALPGTPEQTQGFRTFCGT